MNDHEAIIGVLSEMLPSIRQAAETAKSNRHLFSGSARIQFEGTITGLDEAKRHLEVLEMFYMSSREPIEAGK